MPKQKSYSHLKHPTINMADQKEILCEVLIMEASEIYRDLQMKSGGPSEWKIEIISNTKKY